MPRPVQGLRRRLPGPERRRQLAETALQLLAHEGSVTLARLGEAVGIADASVLKHFPSKEAVVEAAIARFGALLDEDLPPEGDDPLQRLGVFFVRRLTKARARPELLALAYSARLADAAGPAGAMQVNLHIARSADLIRTCVVRAQESGLMQANLPPELWVWIVAGVLRGASGVLPPGLGGAAPVTQTPAEVWGYLEGLMRRGG